MKERLKIPYPVIVEGRYDKLRLESVMEGQILTTDGFGLFNKMEKTMQVELNAFSIGQLGFAHCYNEVFSTVGRYVRANAPFEQVFWITGNSRYLPCKEAYDYRSYEADTSMYARGTAEKVQEKLVEMLQNLK